MKLEQAIRHFNTVPLSGLDQVASSVVTGDNSVITVDTVLVTADVLLGNASVWVPNIAMANFMSFDRFITERSFGQKKRMIEIGGPVGIPEQYTVLRTPDDNTYLVVSVNKDIIGGEVYGWTYLLQEARYTATVVKFGKTSSTYGIATGKSEIAHATVFCDVERMTAEASREFNTVRYSSHVIVLPGSTNVTTDDEIEILGERYEIVEVNRLLRLKEVRAIKRGVA